MKKEAKPFFINLLLLPLLSLGCSLGGTTIGASALLATTCNIPSDQTGTISGRWPVTPIPVAFHDGDFESTVELPALTGAMDTWNAFHTAASKINTLDYGTAATPRTSSANNPNQSGSLCAQSLIQSSKFTGNVVIYKMGRWPNSYPPTAIALTTFCSIAQSPYKRMYMAVMEINYQNFFVSGMKNPDLQSIVLHELGHLEGLDHSCAAGTKAGFPNCNDPNLNADYGSLAASMFPNFSFDATTGDGQQKRILGKNDQERANCLYGTSAK